MGYTIAGYDGVNFYFLMLSFYVNRCTYVVILVKPMVESFQLTGITGRHLYLLSNDTTYELFETVLGPTNG